MADEVDVGNDFAEHERTHKEKEIRKRALIQEVEATGYCLACGEDIFDLGRRWCDANCRDDWTKLNKLQ